MSFVGGFLFLVGGASAETPDVAAKPGSLAVTEPATVQGPSAAEIEDIVPTGQSLTGREIYEKFLRNRIHSAVQHQKVISTDPGGNTQESRFWIRWKDFRDKDDNADEKGIKAKTLIKFMDPFDMKHTGFLMIIYDDESAEQFVYQPSQRRVRRVKLRGTGVMGTDYTFDDIAFQNIEDADYTRHEDEDVDAVATYVVTAVMKPFVDSQYSKTMVYLDKETYVPLKARYWDKSDIEVKELRATRDSIKQFDEIWVATNSTMHNLKEGTSTTVLVEKLEPDANIADNMFSTFRLQLRR